MSRTLLLVKKYSYFPTHRTEMFIADFKSRNLSQITSVHDIPSYYFKKTFCMIFLSMLGSSKWSLSLVFPTRILQRSIFFVFVWHDVPISFPFVTLPNNNCLCLQAVKLIIWPFSLLSSYLLPLRPNVFQSSFSFTHSAYVLSANRQAELYRK
jgi:hypothetical protein